jgi:hypothetical protein
MNMMRRFVDLLQQWNFRYNKIRNFSKFFGDVLESVLLLYVN